MGTGREGDQKQSGRTDKQNRSVRYFNDPDHPGSDGPNS